MNSSKLNLTFYFFFIIIQVLVIFHLSAFRDLSVGDTRNYTDYFLRFSDNNGDFETRFEPLFNLISYFVYLVFDDDYRAFLIIFTILNIFSTLFVIRKIIDVIDVDTLDYKLFYVFSTLSFLLSSSWFFSSMTNGIRQGISINFLILALVYFCESKFRKFLLFSIVSICFHYSSVLFILTTPALLFLSFHQFFIILLISTVLYYVGAYEYVIFILSDFTNVPLYSSINSFDEGYALWSGFQIKFVLYNTFFAIAFYSISRYLSKGCSKTELLVKIYFFLTCNYFLFGFGGYSNRFAFPSWLYIQFILPYLFLKLFPRGNLKLIFSLILFPIGIGLYTYRLFTTTY